MNEATPSHTKNTAEPQITPTQTKMSPLEVSADWWSSWADWLGVAAIIVGAILFVVTAIGWGFTWKAGKLKDRVVARINERAAGLEKEAAQLRLDLAKVDPVNLPVKSISAEVFLLVDGTFFDWYFDTPMPEPPVGFSLMSSEGLIGKLRCTTFKTYPFRYREGDSGKETDARAFTLSFSWPYTDFLTAASPFVMWIDRDNPSVGDLDKMLTSVDVDLPPTEGSATILESQCVVTINGSMRRKFLIPAFVANAAVITCAPIRE